MLGIGVIIGIYSYYLLKENNRLRFWEIVLYFRLNIFIVEII